MATRLTQRLLTPFNRGEVNTDMARWTPVVRVRECSMHPTLEDGQLVLTRPRGWRVQVGDIVVLTTSSGERRVKRIAAQPGDLVELEAGRLYVNQRSYDGQPRTEGARVETWRVPDGHFFVIGDNLRQSDDSRVWHEPFVAVSCISGVAIRRRRPILERPSTDVRASGESQGLVITMSGATKRLRDLWCLGTRR
jgi:signal peptidase I